MSSAQRRQHLNSRNMFTVLAAVLAVAAAVVLVIVVRAQHHAPQPPASAANPAAERNLPVPGPTKTGSSSSTSGATATVGPILARSNPVSLTASSIGIVNAPLAQYGLNSQGAVGIPASKPGVPAGWFTGSPTPGALGPSVIVGHVDSAAGPSIFFKLGDLRPGQQVSVTLADHTVATFQIDSVERYAKAAFPTLQVYGNINHAGLRLITCGGAYDASTGHYVDNIVVYAHLVSSHTA